MKKRSGNEPKSVNTLELERKIKSETDPFADGWTRHHLIQNQGQRSSQNFVSTQSGLLRK